MKAFFPVYAVNEHDARTQIEFTEPPKRTRLVTGAFGFPHADPWSSSLDAAIALCEMRLPAMWGRKHEGANFDEEGWSYEIRVGADDGEYHLGIHNHEPIALLIAMFRALQAQDRE